MATLKAFLQPIEEITKEIEVSDRFKDPKTGEIEKFKIRKLTVSEHQTIESQCLKQTLGRGKKKPPTSKFDTAEYQNLIMYKSVIYPNLDEQDIQDFYGVLSGDRVLPKMLTKNEFDNLFDEISELNGLNDTMDDKVEDAKN